MNPKYTTYFIVCIVAVVAFLGGYLWRGDGSGGPQQETTPSETPAVSVSVIEDANPSPTSSRVPVMHTIRMRDAGGTPASVVVAAGDAVRFINDSSSAVWPASDPHPTHTGCPEFDARRGLMNGEEYTLTFPTPKTCTYHDHLDPTNEAFRGTITVR